MQFDYTVLGTLIGSIVMIITSAAAYMRSNRISNAKANEEVAAANASTTKYQGQDDELKTLRERLDKQDANYAEQKAINADLELRIVLLESSLLGLSMHFSNMMLCESCQHNNKMVIDAIQAIITNVLPQIKAKTASAVHTKNVVAP